MASGAMSPSPAGRDSPLYHPVPPDLGLLCLSRLNTPYLLFETANETLVYSNEAAWKVIPRLHELKSNGHQSPANSSGTDGSSQSTSRSSPTLSIQGATAPRLRSREVFDLVGFHWMDFITATYQKENKVIFSLAKVIEAQERWRKEGEEFSPHLHIMYDEPSIWWISDVTFLDASDLQVTNVDQLSDTAPKSYYAVHLLHRITREKNAIIKPDPLSNKSSFLQTTTASLSSNSSSSAPTSPTDTSSQSSLMPYLDRYIGSTTVPAFSTEDADLSRPPLDRKESEPITPATTDAEDHEMGDDSREPAIKKLTPEFYKLAVESMPQILFTSDKNGVTSYLNQQWYEYTGWPIGEPTQEQWHDVFHPADVEQAAQMYGAAVRAGRDIEVQYRVKNVHGVFRWMLARGRCIRKNPNDPNSSILGFVCTLTDGEDLLQARHEAIQVRQYINTILKSSGMVLVVIECKKDGTDGKAPEDALVTLFEGRIQYLESVGLTRDSILDKPFASINWPDRDCTNQVNQMLAQGATSNGPIAERNFTTSLGDTHLRYRLTPLYETQLGETSSDLSGVALVCTEITAAVQAELALQQSQEERAALLASETAAKEASRAKTVFVTSLSHEIRTPISGIIGISELLLADPTLSSKQRSLVEKQLQSGELLLRLVSMVLDIGKLEADKLEIERQPFYLTDLIKDLDIFISLAEVKKLYFNTDYINVEYNDPLLGDKLRLTQVLSNFISNAIKFTGIGGVTLTVEQAVEDQNVSLLFKIQDTGVGIDKDTLPQLFQPFHQASVSVAREYGGSGLGLTIAKSLTELMGGTVHLESEVGVGTVVVLTIPVQKTKALPRSSSLQSVPQAMKRAAEMIDREGVSILICEDNRLLQDIYVALVNKMGFSDVTVADDGQHALDLMERTTFDLVLMDCEMPRLTGYQAVAIIRKHPNPAVRSLKIIALTANAISGDKERLLGIGMDMYLSKPVRASVLESAILQCLTLEDRG